MVDNVCVSSDSQQLRGFGGWDGDDSMSKNWNRGQLLRNSDLLDHLQILI